MGTRSKPLILALDGRSGTGKTHLSLQLAAWVRDGGIHGELYSVDVLHLDELYPGWTGLAAGLETYTQQVLPALVRDGSATWTPWNWHTSRHDAPRALGPADIIIIEGVGAGHPAARPFLAGTLTLTLETATRKERALARDGATYAPHWDTWAAQEDQLPAASDGPNDISISVNEGDNVDVRHNGKAGASDVLAQAQAWFSTLTALP